MAMESTSGSSLGDYSDGVYSVIDCKAEAQADYAAAANKPLPLVKPPMLPLATVLMLASLLSLFIFCFIGILVSGLHFGHRVPSDRFTSDVCLGQSCVMFSVRTYMHIDIPTSLHFITPLSSHLISSAAGLLRCHSKTQFDRPSNRHASNQLKRSAR